MRIVGGLYKGKKLETPADNITRPTSDKAKEGLFNILNSLLLKADKKWTDIIFLDVFAGTGSMGIEALSHGASQVFFMENYPLALKCLAKNTQPFSNAHIIRTDATIPPSASKTANIVFLDAPYGKGLWEKALIQLFDKKWLDKKSLIIAETDKNEDIKLPDSFILKDQRHYGRNQFLFIQKE